ncbi:MAG: hypothetical protein WCD79_13935 [Chthoniobacteraceae bacterium]
MTAQPAIAPAMQKAIYSAILQQVVILVIAGCCLDGGILFQMCLYASAGFCACVILIILRRSQSPTKLDLMFIRSGSLPACVISFFLTSAIWHWRGF